jgi:hypothetical protein
VCSVGCARRCRKAARAAGWLLADGVWRHLTNGEPSFLDADVDEDHKAIAWSRPSIRKEVWGVVKAEALGGMKGTLERMGLPLS